MAKLYAYIFQVIFYLCIASAALEGHEGHHHENETAISEQKTSPASDFEAVSFDQIIHWLGNFHPVILHFPIALIVMTVFSELLFLYYKNSLFDDAARFMIFAAAIFAIPTALLGLAYGYGAHYEGVLATYFWWHRFLGIFTALLAVVAVVFREMHARKQWNTMKAYAICLTIIFISVNIAAYLGGEMTFGEGVLLPPHF